MMLSLQPANQATIKRWRKFAFANAGTSGLLGVVNVIHKIFPVERLRNFPDYESFIYVAFAIAIITGLFLLILNKVIAVSFAQLGGITSLVYIGYSLIGIFSPTLLPVFYAYISVAVLVIIIVFGQSLNFFYRQQDYADMILGFVFLAVTVFSCTYPMYHFL